MKEEESCKVIGDKRLKDNNEIIYFENEQTTTLTSPKHLQLTSQNLHNIKFANYRNEKLTYCPYHLTKKLSRVGEFQEILSNLEDGSPW